MFHGPLQQLLSRSRHQKRTKYVFCTRSKKIFEKWVFTFRTQNFVYPRGSGPPLRWGWVFLERTRILSGIQFTTYFIEFFVVETKRFVGSFVNVILTLQTCGQRSSRAAESKRRALGNHFSQRLCYMILMPKCKRNWDLGLRNFWVLAKREPLRNDDLRFFLRAKHVFFRKSSLCSGFLFASTQKVHRPRS